MNIAFGRLHTRLSLLLAVVVIAAVVATALAFALTTRSTSAERMSRGLHAQVVAADALRAMPDRAAADAQMQRLGMRWGDALPPGERSGMRLLRKAEALLGARVPGRAVRLGGAPAELWVRTQDGQAWIVIPVIGDGQPLKRGVLWSLIAIAALVLVAATAFARTLTRPLRRLADAAPAIVAGEAPPTLRMASVEMRELQQSLAAAAEQMRAVARDRELMLAGLSHDMRTPLARLRYGLALIEADLEPSAREAMEGDIEEIDAIVGQFIDYVRDGRDEPSIEVDLVALLKTLAERESHAERVWALHLPEFAALRGRPLALQRALENLITNAVKHGAAPFEIALDPLPTSNDAIGWRLRVGDRGPGVPPARLGDLSRPFQRVDDAHSTPGSGLGLASVARVAAVHHGRLELRNREDGGFEAELDVFDA